MISLFLTKSEVKSNYRTDRRDLIYTANRQVDRGSSVSVAPLFK